MVAKSVQCFNFTVMFDNHLLQMSVCLKGSLLDTISVFMSTYVIYSFVITYYLFQLFSFLNQTILINLIKIVETTTDKVSASY